MYPVPAPTSATTMPGRILKRIQRAFRILFLLAFGTIQPVRALHAHHARDLPAGNRMLALSGQQVAAASAQANSNAG